MAKSTLGKRIFFTILLLFVAFAVLFMVFQQYREREYKTETLNLRLQDYNTRMAETINYVGNYDEKTLETFTEHHLLPTMRVTVTDTAGVVVYDNKRKDYGGMENHRERKEIRDALRYGSGYDIRRESASTKGSYFYSATYFPSKGVVIRSALPYDDNLTASLRADQHYLWFAFIVMLVLTLVLYRFIMRLDTNISKLRIFAKRADRNESLETEDLAQFPDDELGEISESIIKIYKRLQQTKEEQSRLKKQLTQNVAHELKTPVASIQGYLETIIANPGMEEKTRETFIERCFAQSQRLASLLADISTLNRLDDGRGSMEFEEVDVAKVVRQIEQETALMLAERNMEMDNRLPRELRIWGCQSMIYSIFRNLTDNAIAYAGEGTKITITVYEPTEGKWHFTFQDNGVGVEGKHLPRLFERFYRVDKGRSRKMGGTGLGLAIVKNAVLLHGGTISASNALKGGLRMDFTISSVETSD